MIRGSVSHQGRSAIPYRADELYVAENERATFGSHMIEEAAMGRTQGKGWRVAGTVLGSLGRGVAAALGVIGVALSGVLGGQAPGPDLPPPRKEYRP